MSASPFVSLDAPGIRVDAQRDGVVLRVAMSGSVEARDPAALFDPYWSGLDEAVRALGLTQVELDLSRLDFMNSSGILTLVRWVMKLKARPDYELLIRYDDELTWQRTNVPVLTKLAPAVVRMSRR